MSSKLELPAEFVPWRPAPRAPRLAAFVLGPVLWLAALIVVGLVVDQRDAVEIGLMATFVALVVFFAVSLLARELRIREERKAGG